VERGGEQTRKRRGQQSGETDGNLTQGRGRTGRKRRRYTSEQERRDPWRKLYRTMERTGRKKGERNGEREGVKKFP